VRTWKLEDAKNRFSEVVRRAAAHEPQLVTKNGRLAAVVVGAEDYERLTTGRGTVQFLRESPLADAYAEGGLHIPRRRDPGRDVEL